MGVVVQNDKNCPERFLIRRPRIRGGLAVLAVAALAAGCAQPGTRVRPVPGPPHPQAPPVAAPGSYADRLHTAYAQRVAVARRWSLERVPLIPPQPPRTKPRATARAGFEVKHQRDWNLPPVFTTVPTKDKVVFLTIDDEAEKDPEFLRMMRDLKIPYTAFLTDDLIRSDYGYFWRMQGQGVTLNNHTLHHPYLPGLSYDQQKSEICGMQDIMEERFGKRPRMFRPPYGDYDQDTLRAAKSCGIEDAPIWNEEVDVDHWEFRQGDQRLRPGDIVLTHFRGRRQWHGTMADDMRRFLNRVTADGYAVARLEDYL
ncbi:polysaccharide deacetylase family protein [Streptomyces sp. NPDC004069]